MNKVIKFTFSSLLLLTFCAFALKTSVFASSSTKLNLRSANPKCESPSTPENPESQETPEGSEGSEGSENPEDSEDGSEDSEPSVSGNCACQNGCGKQSASGLFSQNDGRNTYQSVLWKTGGDKDVQTSGCSLVAVVNAANALGQSNTIESVAAWSYKNLKVSTGSWSGTVKPIASHLGLKLYDLFDNVHSGGNKTTNVSEKLALIKQALASNLSVVVSGQVSGSCSNRASSAGVSGTTFANQGNCVFTNGGHYVSIVGVTSDNKLVVGNPALGSKSATGWVFPAENVLQFADIAKAVGTANSTGLSSCSSGSTSAND
ncbi:C39 family peptidase [Candidatus Saccharibacteria bacterium]|nr:C39 family peptidase [Candidatus Saccharibacteria bacterium]